jgi:hypothetical protein
MRILQRKAQNLNLKKVLKLAHIPHILACHLQIDADPDPPYTLIQIQIQLITLMRIRIRTLPLNLMRIRIHNTAAEVTPSGSILR